MLMLCISYTRHSSTSCKTSGRITHYATIRKKRGATMINFYYNLINNWQLYAFIFIMIAFVLIFIISILVMMAKQDDPTIELPTPILWFIKVTGL